MAAGCGHGLSTRGHRDGPGIRNEMEGGSALDATRRKARYDRAAAAAMRRHHHF